MSLGLNLGQGNSSNSNLFIPSQNNLDDWFRQPTTDGETLVNSKINSSTGNGLIKTINCISVTSGDTITISGLSSSASVSSIASGSVTPSVSSNTLTFGSTGICSNIVLSDGTHLPLAEGFGTKVFDISGQGNHGTLSGTTWTTTDNALSHNHRYGHNNTINLDDSVFQYIDLSSDSALTNIFEGTQLTDTSFVLDARIKFNKINAFQVIFSQNSNRGFLWRLSNGGLFQLFVGGGYVNTGVALTGLAVDQWIDTRLEYNSTGTTFTAKAKLAGDSAYTTLFTGSRAFQSLTGSDGVSVSLGGNLIFGMKENVGSGFVNHFDGQVQTIKVTNNNGVYFDCASAGSGVHNKITGTFIAAQKTQGGAGTATTLTNTRVPAFINKTLAFYSPDGSNDSIFFNHSLNSSSDWQAESEFIVADTASTQQAVFSATGTTNNDYGFMLRYEDSATRWRLRIADTTSFYITKPLLVIGDVYKVTLSYFSSTNKCTLVVEKNGVAETFVDNQSISNTPDFNGEAAVARLRWSGSYGGWNYKTVKFTQGTTTNVELDIANSTGLTTVADLSGNGNNGTLQNSTLTVNWAKRYVDTSGDIVTGYYAGGNIDVTNPSGYVHNNSECRLLQSGLTSANILSINNSTATQNFSKGDKTTRFTSGYHLVKELLVYSTTISGGELIRTRIYVGE
jgi:hypothetical protein